MVSNIILKTAKQRRIQGCVDRVEIEAVNFVFNVQYRALGNISGSIRLLVRYVLPILARKVLHDVGNGPKLNSRARGVIDF